ILNVKSHSLGEINHGHIPRDKLTPEESNPPLFCNGHAHLHQFCPQPSSLPWVTHYYGEFGFLLSRLKYQLHNPKNSLTSGGLTHGNNCNLAVIVNLCKAYKLFMCCNLYNVKESIDYCFL